MLLCFWGKTLATLERFLLRGVGIHFFWLMLGGRFFFGEDGRNFCLWEGGCGKIGAGRVSIYCNDCCFVALNWLFVAHFNLCLLVAHLFLLPLSCQNTLFRGWCYYNLFLSRPFTIKAHHYYYHHVSPWWTTVKGMFIHTSISQYFFLSVHSLYSFNFCLLVKIILQYKRVQGVVKYNRYTPVAGHA